MWHAQIEVNILKSFFTCASSLAHVNKYSIVTMNFIIYLFYNSFR